MPKLIWACRRVEIGWPTKALCGVMCGILMLLWVCNAICVIWRHWAILVFSSQCVALAFSNEELGALRWKNWLERRATQSRAKFVETLFLLWPMVLKNNAKQWCELWYLCEVKDHMESISYSNLPFQWHHPRCNSVLFDMTYFDMCSFEFFNILKK